MIVRYTIQSSANRRISEVTLCLPDSPKPDSPKLGFRVRVRVRVSVSANRVSANGTEQKFRHMRILEMLY